MSEPRYKLANRPGQLAVAIIDGEGQELIALPERVRAEFAQDILRAVNTAYVCGAEAERERIQGEVVRIAEEFRQDLLAVDNSLREPPA